VTGCHSARLIALKLALSPRRRISRVPAGSSERIWRSRRRFRAKAARAESAALARSLVTKQKQVEETFYILPEDPLKLSYVYETEPGGKRRVRCITT